MGRLAPAGEPGPRASPRGRSAGGDQQAAPLLPRRVNAMAVAGEDEKRKIKVGDALDHGMGDALARFVLVGTASLAVVAGHPRGARAAEPCARLEAPPDLPAPWADAIRDLTRALAELPPAQCQPLALLFEPAGEGVRIIAQGQDGRRAVRIASQPSMLVPTAMGLVLSIPREEEEPTTIPATSPRGLGPPPEPTPITSPGLPASAASTSPVAVGSPNPLAIWLGVAIGARIGAPSTISMAEVEGRADLRFDRLLLFVSFRNVPVGFVAHEGFDGDAYHESSIAFGVGRSFPLGRYSVDASIAPSLVAMRLSEDNPARARASDVQLRVGASARFNVPLSASWRLTIAADTDVIPDNLRSVERIDPLPAFPSWTTGLLVGVTGELL